MGRFPLAVILASLAFALIAAAWWYVDKNAGSQLAAYRVGQAATLADAKRHIAAVEQQRDHEQALRKLVSGWRTGNQRFDYYLAAYISDRQSSEDLRRLFSLELSWRPELLADWAHYWSWRTKQSPAAEISSIAGYLDTLVSAAPPRRLTWREVLDFQAALTLTGNPELARRLVPDNWQERFHAWRKATLDMSQVRRPSEPLPGWQGPVTGVAAEQ